MIATQDRDLQEYLRKKPGQPILYLHKKTPVLEQPSELSRKTVEFKLNASFTFGDADVKKLGVYFLALNLYSIIKFVYYVRISLCRFSFN